MQDQPRFASVSQGITNNNTCAATAAVAVVAQRQAAVAAANISRPVSSEAVCVYANGSGNSKTTKKIEKQQGKDRLKGPSLSTPEKELLFFV